MTIKVNWANFIEARNLQMRGNTEIVFVLLCANATVEALVRALGIIYGIIGVHNVLPHLSRSPSAFVNYISAAPHVQSLHVFTASGWQPSIVSSWSSLTQSSCVCCDAWIDLFMDQGHTSTNDQLAVAQQLRPHITEYYFAIYVTPFSRVIALHLSSR